MKSTLTLQIVPIVEPTRLYPVIDEAIEVIQNSGLEYVVSPSGTTIEGELNHLLEVVEQAQQACFSAGAEELAVDIKIHRRKNKDTTIVEKVGKYN